jgi:hypothetical protein
LRQERGVLTPGNSRFVRFAQFDAASSDHDEQRGGLAFGTALREAFKSPFEPAGTSWWSLLTSNSVVSGSLSCRG